MSENSTDLNLEHGASEPARPGRRRRKRMVIIVLLLDALLLLALLGAQAYGYKLRSALRFAPFKTIGPLSENSGPLFDRSAALSADPEAPMSGDNRVITVTGNYSCLSSEGESLIHAIVSQESSGAFAKGSFQGPCTGQVEQFSIKCTEVQEFPPFQEGRVKIEALGLNRRGTTEWTISDAFFWGRFAMAVRADPGASPSRTH